MVKNHTRVALSDFHYRRMWVFKGNIVQESKHPRLLLNFKPDNLVSALDMWLVTENFLTTEPSLVDRLTQSFNLNTLEKRDYLQVLDALDKLVQHYVEVEESLGAGD